MRWPGLTLATVILFQLMGGQSSGQRARFLSADRFDRTYLQPRTSVQVSYYTEGNHEARAKGYVSEVGEGSFTVASASSRTRVPYRDVGILVIGRTRPEIFLFRDRPAAVPDVKDEDSGSRPCRDHTRCPR